MKQNTNAAKLNIGIEQMDTIAYLLNSDAKVLNCSTGFLKAINQQREDVIGKNFSELPIKDAHTIDKNNQLLMSAKVKNYEAIECIAAQTDESKQNNLFDVNKLLVFDDAGKFNGLLALYQPRKEDKKQQSYVPKETKHRFREVLNALHSFESQLTAITCYNDQAEAIKGIQAAIKGLNPLIDDLQITDITERKTTSWNIPEQSSWLKALWITNTDTSGFQATFEDKREVKVTAATTSEFINNAEIQKQVTQMHYQIVVVDANVFDDKLAAALNNAVRSNLVIATGHKAPTIEKSEQYPHIDFKHTVTQDTFLTEYHEYLPNIWNSYITKRTTENIEATGKMNILLVEDNAESRAALEQMLQTYGFLNIAAVANEKEALKEVNDTEFDLIILDIGLDEEFDGLQAALKIRNTQKDLGQIMCPILANTGQEVSPNAYIQYGINETYVKPSLMRNLHKTLEYYLPKPFLIIND